MTADTVARRVASIIYADALRTFGGPGHLRPGRNGDPLVTRCAGCGADADDVSVDPWTERCDDCQWGLA